jgi:hypothetical protein
MSSASAKQSHSKIKHFPKYKRETPDELDPVPLLHVCVDDDGDKMMSLHWVVQMRYDGLEYICMGCGSRMTHDEVLEIFKGD